jgi:hypothetical protein
VRRLLPKREALQALFARSAQLDQRRVRLKAQLESQEAELAELRPRVRAALARPDPEPTQWAGESVVTDEEIDLELLRRRDVAITAEGRR